MTNFQILDGGVSPIEFKLLFTSAERIAINASVDPVVIDFMSIVDDQRTTKINLTIPSTVNALNYLVSLTLLADTRVDEILEAKAM